MKTNMTLSHYQIVWVEFVPEFGVVTKHDQAAFGATNTYRNQKSFRRHFPSREKAEAFLNNFSKKLNKKYTCYFFTDRQFGLAKEADGYKIPYTSYQLTHPYFL